MEPRRATFVIVALVVACATTNPLGRNQYSNVTSYAVPPYAKGSAWTGTTPAGHPIYDPDHKVDPAKLDAAVARLNACLAKLPPLTAAEKAANSCYQSVDVPKGAITTPKWLGFYVAPDAARSRCTGTVVFPCSVDPGLCAQKPWLDEVILERNPGMTPDQVKAECPCKFCRSAVQDNAVVVSWDLADPAVLGAVLGDVVRLETSCNNPWHAPLATCLTTPAALAW